MIIKMMITFDYDPETNEYTPIKQEIIKEKVTTKKEVVEEELSDPTIYLYDNRYMINIATAKLLEVEPGDRVDIKYQSIDNVVFPIIGSEIAWGGGSGNKLTKSLTVSCRGQANSLLAEYGNKFSLTPWNGHKGLFVLIGNDQPIKKDDNIEIKEDIEDSIDIKDNFEDSINIKDDFELNDIEFNF